MPGDKSRGGWGTLISPARVVAAVSSDDPTDVRALAVHADDVITALEANARRDAGAVLRVTPPFAGRMRARLHLDGREADYADPEPLHIPPEAFVPDPPAFPDPDDTEDELRADPDAEYTAERHRRAHAAAVETWRAAVRERIADTATVETPAGPHEVDVSVLG